MQSSCSLLNFPIRNKKADYCEPKLLKIFKKKKKDKFCIKETTHKAYDVHWVSLLLTNALYMDTIKGLEVVRKIIGLFAFFKV